MPLSARHPLCTATPLPARLGAAGPLVLALALALALVLPPGGPSRARAQAAADPTAVVLVVRAGDHYLAEHVRPVQRGATRALGRDRVRPHRATEDECVPTEGDASCARALVRGARAGRLLYIWVRWERAGGATITRDGEIVGHRSLRAPSVHLELYAADGSLVGTSDVDLPADGDAAALTEAAVRALVTP